jgi:hypothetical protein
MMECESLLTAKFTGNILNDSQLGKTMDIEALAIEQG